MTFAPPPVWVYELVREWTTHAWLCEGCLARRRAQDWTIRGRRLPPPRRVEIVAPGADGALPGAGASCPAAWDDREPLACQDCHLAALPACPTCDGPAVYPGAVGLEQCQDPAHAVMNRSTEAPEIAREDLRTKGGRGKKFTKLVGSP